MNRWARSPESLMEGHNWFLNQFFEIHRRSIIVCFLSLSAKAGLNLPPFRSSCSWPPSLISNGGRFKLAFAEIDKKQTMIDLRGISTNWIKNQLGSSIRLSRLYGFCLLREHSATQNIIFLPFGGYLGFPNPNPIFQLNLDPNWGIQIRSQIHEHTISQFRWGFWA